MGFPFERIYANPRRSLSKNYFRQTSSANIPSTIVVISSTTTGVRATYALKWLRSADGCAGRGRGPPQSMDLCVARRRVSLATVPRSRARSAVRVKVTAVYGGALTIGAAEPHGDVSLPARAVVGAHAR